MLDEATREELKEVIAETLKPYMGGDGFFNASAAIAVTNQIDRRFSVSRKENHGSESPTEFDKLG